MASRLADYGFTCIRLTDDYQGADFLARHSDQTTLEIQLKGRFSVDATSYLGKNVWMAFIDRETDKYYLYPHDEAYHFVAEDVTNPVAEFHDHGKRHWGKMTKRNRLFLENYEVKP